MEKPTVGRIVHYVLSEQDCEVIKNARVPHAMRPFGELVRLKWGNPPVPGAHVAMMIVAIFPGNSDNQVNGQVLLDGNDSHWVTSAAEGEGGGTWHWPEREE